MVGFLLRLCWNSQAAHPRHGYHHVALHRSLKHMCWTVTSTTIRHTAHMETGCDSILALQLHRCKGEHTVLKQTITYSSFVTETISNMSAQSATPTAILPTSTSTGKGMASAGAITQLGTIGNTTFGMPAGITLPQFDGTGWSNWSGILEALLVLHKAEDVFMHSHTL